MSPIADRQALALAHGQKNVLELIARGAPIEETLDALTRLIEAQSPDLLCSILLLDPESRLRHGAAPRLPEAYTSAIDGTHIGPAVGSCGTAAFHGRAVYVEDIATDPLWEAYRDLALRHGLRACWSTPIRDEGGRVLGTFAIYYEKPGLPAERHLHLIELATHTAAICLSRHSHMQALRDSEQRFRQLAESLPQLVWTCQPSGECDFLSRQWREYTGVDEGEQLGFGWLDQVHPADREAALAAWRAAVSSSSEYRVELRLRRHDGAYRWFDTRAVPIRGPEGRVVKWSGSNTDINDRKRSEDSQLRSQKLESLGTLAGGIAHDFNNMLLVIQGNAQLAEGLVGKDHPAQPHLSEITQASLRASDLVRRILSFSRPQKRRHKLLHLGPVIDEALKLVRATLPAMIDIRAQLSADVPVVSADITQIHQVIINLATNASHAIGQKGGLIEVILETVDLPAEVATANALRPGRYVRVGVRDNGAGMSRDTVAKIFDPFFTTKPVGQGTGLGLSIVHGIMHGSGGTVTVQSEPGRGTTFQLYFPAAQGEAGQDSAATQTSPTLGEGQRVLFVDDEEAVVRLATLCLTRLGYVVTGCTDPAAAIAQFRREPKTFDAVVTDLSMPGMSGFDCARELLALRPDLPIVMTSGYVRQEDEAMARELGIRAVLNKPSAINDLGETLARILAAPRAPPLS